MKQPRGLASGEIPYLCLQRQEDCGRPWSHNIWPISTSLLQPWGRIVSGGEKGLLSRLRRLSTMRKVVQTLATAHDSQAAGSAIFFLWNKVAIDFARRWPEKYGIDEKQNCHTLSALVNMGLKKW